MENAKNLTIFLIFLLIVVFVNADKIVEVKSEDHCANAVYIPGTCVKFVVKYYFVEDIPKTSWLEAQHICRRNNANLLTIENEAEMKAISDYLIEQKFNDYEDFGFWTAGSDLVDEHEFMSIGNGDVLYYKKWANDEPQKGKHCVGLKATNITITSTISNAKAAFQMHALDCEERFAYICEMNTKGTEPYRKRN